MANSIGWGQGAVNNSIGWGQGAINNAISWGSVYETTNVGETVIYPIQAIINAFKIRVVADGGVFEAEQCLFNLIDSL